MKGIGIGLVGLGWQGSEHLRCLLACPEAEIVALCDIDETALARAEAVARQGGQQPRLFRHFRELLGHPGLSAVFISVPDDLHEQVAVAAFQAGKDVFLEKPVAHTPQAVDAILAAAEKSGRVLQVGLVYRYSLLYRRMAEIARSGQLGRPQIAWCKEFRPPFPDLAWYHSQARTGGSLNEKDCHHFDLFNWMLASRPRRVCAFGSRAVLVPGGGYPSGGQAQGAYGHLEQGDNVDQASVIIEYENGALGQLNLCLFLSPPDWSHHFYEIGLIGSNGRVLNSDLYQGRITISGGQGFSPREEITVKEIPGPAVHPGGMLQHLEFLECVKERKEPFASGGVGREASLIAFAAERSIQEGRVVSIEEIGAPSGRADRPVAAG